jgi:hypothetical protein
MSAQDDMVVLLIKGAISDLPPEGQKKVKEHADALRAQLKLDREQNESGGYFTMAFALVGAELSAGGE